MNIKECKDAALKLINQYSIAGTQIALSYNNQADYILRMVELINSAQMEIAKTTKKIYAQHDVVQMAVPNLLPHFSLDTKTHLGVDDIYEASQSAKAYYFEVNKPATVYIEQKQGATWSTVATINAEPTEFTAYKGLISTTGPTRIRFSGDYPYVFRNVGLYEVSFASASDIVPARPYIEYDMPDNFYQLVGRGIPLYKGAEFVMSHQYRWRGRKTLLLSRDLSGEFLIDYYRFPTPITSSTSETTELDNTQDTHEAIPYYVASGIVRIDNPSLSATLYNMFETKLVRLNEAVQSDVTQIEDVYGTWGV